MIERSEVIPSSWMKREGWIVRGQESLPVVVSPLPEARGDYCWQWDLI